MSKYSRPGKKRESKLNSKSAQRLDAQIRKKVARLLSSLILKHQLFHKYKKYDREYKSLQHEVAEYTQQLEHLQHAKEQEQGEHEHDDTGKAGSNELELERLECEQRIEDTQSTI